MLKRLASDKALPPLRSNHAYTVKITLRCLLGLFLMKVVQAVHECKTCENGVHCSSHAYRVLTILCKVYCVHTHPYRALTILCEVWCPTCSTIAFRVRFTCDCPLATVSQWLRRASESLTDCRWRAVAGFFVLILTAPENAALYIMSSRAINNKPCQVGAIPSSGEDQRILSRFNLIKEDQKNLSGFNL